mmetsp:Transcript_4870/g.5275  ORF Transcript_4870/g.5275 Transcript_4870/m.5275 type:complete len:189 (-) Transcript_4870:62-628(-)
MSECGGCGSGNNGNTGGGNTGGGNNGGNNGGNGGGNGGGNKFKLLSSAQGLGANVTASSSFDCNHMPTNSAIDRVPPQVFAHAWVAGRSDSSQWLQFSFGFKIVKAMAVRTQGRGEAGMWVKQYTVSTTMDGLTWTPVENNRVFNGNSDMKGQVENTFSKPVLCRALRIHPTSWQVLIAMRADVMVKI